jgi:hypothetical protein
MSKTTITSCVTAIKEKADKNILNFVIFVATKKGRTTNFFSPLSFVAVFGTEIRDPEWTKIGIRDVHKSDTLLYSSRQHSSKKRKVFYKFVLDFHFASI